MLKKEQDVVQFCIDKLSVLNGTSVQLINSVDIGGGCINNAKRLNTSIGISFLKWNINAPSDIFIKEAAGLNEMQLECNPFLTIPKVIWCKEGGEYPGLLLTEYLLPSRNASGFDEKLGRGIASLHRKTASNYGFHHSNYCGTTVQNNAWNDTWSTFFARQRIWSLVEQIRKERGISAEDMMMYEKLVAKLEDLLSHNTIPSLIHGDLWSGNYMYTEKGPALIDPACYYADREMELGMMQLFGGFSSSVWDAYQEEWPLPPGWQERIKLYQLYHVLNHYLLFGGSYGRQAAEIARSYL